MFHLRGGGGLDSVKKNEVIIAIVLLVLEAIFCKGELCISLLPSL